MADGLAKAQQAAVQADDAAQSIASRAAEAGFAGVAQNLSRLREAIREVHAGSAAVSGLMGEASTAVAMASGQTTPAETTAILEPVTQMSTMSGARSVW
jgi:hypothetical protein